MKLVNLNICIKIDNTEKVIEFLKSVDADIMVLQEVMNPLDDKSFKPFRSKEDIDKTIGKNYPYKFFGPMFKTDVHKKKDGVISKNFGGMVEQGSEILSKFPIVEYLNNHYYLEYGYYWNFANWEKDDHPRSLTIVELNVNGKRLQIITIHGLWSADKKGTERTMHQCEHILKVAKQKSIPTIIAGDFNLLPETKEIRMLSKNFRNLIDEFKIKSTIPECKEYDEKPHSIYDYIFVNDKIKVNSFKTINTTVSDHMPLILEFDIL